LLSTQHTSTYDQPAPTKGACAKPSAEGGTCSCSNAQMTPGTTCARRAAWVRLLTHASLNSRHSAQLAQAARPGERADLVAHGLPSKERPEREGETCGAAAAGQPHGACERPLLLEGYKT